MTNLDRIFHIQGLKCDLWNEDQLQLIEIEDLPAVLDMEQDNLYVKPSFKDEGEESSKFIK